MRGKLELVTVPELLRFALREDRSGTLELEHDGEHGRIAFSRGWITEAVSPRIRGLVSDSETTTQALAELVQWNRGGFCLDLTVDDHGRELALEVDLSRLLREAMIARERRGTVR